ncbi:MAG: anthranilate synthase component I [Candidatus Omnitrophica bacterium]|nr:anthranilate synthase component I [Candidatus Omnitrophota bacterium]MDD5591816.1 anthranilate synthase component I [Candidatus Omnitrophota bacterium]
MYYPSLKEFLELSKKYNLIPVYQEISADLDTPVSAFLKIKKGDYAFLLESVEGQEKIARYSFLGSNPALIFRSKGRDVRVIYPARSSARHFVTRNDPLDEIKKIMQDFKAARIKELPRFYGGLVGFMAYDMVRFFEDLPDRNPDDLKIADSVFILTDSILVFDHINHTIKIIVNIILPAHKKIPRVKKTQIYYQALKKIDSICNELKKPLLKKAKRNDTGKRSIKVISNFKEKEFCKIVNKARDYIKKGDIIQTVLSQRFEIKIDKDPFDIYRDLRSLNPSPYMFFLKLKEVTLVGSSPEILVRCEDGIARTRPIAGTRPRGKNEKEDKQLEKELLEDKKERAEHLMLVDLGRNDLGKVCKKGKVAVSEFMSIERYSHVMHIVSEVEGILDKRYNIYDVLRACFPAGTVSGSPKIRAMEIIDELENLRRGPYAGCVGYFSFSHNMDTCITLRTVIIKDGMAYIQAGAGIVADSVPKNEYQESINKAKALIEAIVK